MYARMRDRQTESPWVSAALATCVNLTWELDITPAAPPRPVWPRRERTVPRVDQNQPVTRGLKTGVEGPSPWALFIQMAPNSDLGPYSSNEIMDTARVPESADMHHHTEPTTFTVTPYGLTRLLQTVVL